MRKGIPEGTAGAETLGARREREGEREDRDAGGLLGRKYGWITGARWGEGEVGGARSRFLSLR